MVTVAATVTATVAATVRARPGRALLAGAAAAPGGRKGSRFIKGGCSGNRV